MKLRINLFYSMWVPGRLRLRLLGAPHPRYEAVLSVSAVVLGAVILNETISTQQVIDVLFVITAITTGVARAN